MKNFVLISLATILVVGCSSEKEIKKSPSLFTSDTSKKAFTHAVKFESDVEEDLHILGKSFFTIPWVEAPSATTARDGLGPLFSANTCLHCHPSNGAGLAVDKNGELTRSLVMRLSIKNKENINNDLTRHNGFLPEPVYGGQLSINGTSDTPYEGAVDVTYNSIKGTYKDGEPYELQTPTYNVKNLQYGELHKDVNIAPRIGLALVGLGALEMIDKKDILKHEDIQDSDGDGISGKANWVFNPETNATELGRFTWKAAAATLKQQSGNAAHNDMGLSNPLYPNHNCTQTQELCQKAIGQESQFDLPMQRLDAVAFYLKSLKIPAQRKSKNFEKGKKIFNDLGCVKCHVDSYTLADGNTISPYSDLLLHDMGDGLADGHTMFRASEREFRTPPLWGIGLYEKISGSVALLHDGRARSIEEAILWHGGEAQMQQEKFKALSKENRAYLVEFLKGI